MSGVSITAPTNPLVKRLQRLHRAAQRRAAGLFLIEGERAITALLALGWQPQHLLHRQGDPVPADWPPACACSAAVIDRLSQARTASGYLAVFPIPAPAAIDPAAGGLLCWAIRDPGNLGSLLRSAAAFGQAQVVLVDCCDPWGPKTVQSSAGVVPVIALAAYEHEQARRELLPRGLALVPREGRPPTDFPAGERPWLVIGNEAHGLPAEVITACAARLTLPMRAEVESLNAAMAGSIACYCFRRC